MALTLLHPKPGQAIDDAPVVDIVAVHGLNGDPSKTWTEPKSKSFWLRDFLAIGAPTRAKDTEKTRFIRFRGLRQDSDWPEVRT